MPDIQAILTQRLQQAVAASFGDTYAGGDPQVRPSAQSQFGDYQANCAMSLAKQAGVKPRDAAQKIVAALNVNDVCEKVEIAGPGFINLHLSAPFLVAAINELAKDARLGVPVAHPPRTVVVDYSSPNVAKEMHVGHLRSTIIGDAIARVLSFQGHRVIRQNHLGDWGTQFGMLIQYIVELFSFPMGDNVSAAIQQNMEHLREAGVEQLAQGGGSGMKVGIKDLDQLYKASKKRFDADADFAERARKRVTMLQGGDEETLRFWRALIEESKHHFNEAYQRLGVLLTDDDVRGESAYNPYLADVVDDLTKRGFATESQGATVLHPKGFPERDGQPQVMIIRKSDGGFLYATTDLAAARFRINQLHADRIVYVTDARQADHFAMLFWALRETGWAGETVRLDHVPFGTVLGTDKKPLKARAGDAVKLRELLDEASERAMKVLEEKNPELSQEQRAQVARAVGIGALKYADLSCDRIKDYVFDWDRMLSFDGNTAPYIQNAYVRVFGIFRKGNVDPDSLCDAAIVLSEPAERALAVKLLQFAGVVDGVALSLEPHKLCGYLYDLASNYHKFFETCPVLSAPDETTKRSRLHLGALTAAAFKLGLSLLGIDVVERM